MDCFQTRQIGREHPDYPIVLRCMRRPPECIFVKGALPEQRGVAIVGTRCASEGAVRYTLELAARIARAGLCVWSGGAAGVDRAAHEGALSGGGKTVVVMGTGFDHTYPVEHRELYDRILLEGGAWMSSFEPSRPGSRFSFLMRNEVLASMVDAVILVQAPIRSGARSTAAAARRFAKSLFVVPSAPWDLMSYGCIEELRKGAIPLYSVGDLLSSFGEGKRGSDEIPRSEPARLLKMPSELSEDQAKVVKSVGGQAVYPDEICEKTGLPARTVSAALLTLTLRNVVVQGSDGRFRLQTI